MENIVSDNNNHFRLIMKIRSAQWQDGGTSHTPLTQRLGQMFNIMPIFRAYRIKDTNNLNSLSVNAYDSESKCGRSPQARCKSRRAGQRN
ncbi:hypothetical protein IMPR6_160038 [Imperialibacter sp. EC-SDR9]|nr:hypothetical protein IMPERIA89_10405 [Imperialibacter sp. 89]CAD5264603.1 hypothetical protein IMPERIA75_30111 [Imperialibacter sp. 75]VVT06737.1 hypothetical protein IMPR6_160038 [Imperialibacter sp. EC-SDR9]